jgi:chromosome segregation ATPase
MSKERPLTESERLDGAISETKGALDDAQRALEKARFDVDSPAIDRHRAEVLRLRGQIEKLRELRQRHDPDLERVHGDLAKNIQRAGELSAEDSSLAARISGLRQERGKRVFDGGDPAGLTTEIEKLRLQRESLTDALTFAETRERESRLLADDASMDAARRAAFERETAQ